ncbi:helix-turn-helix transcriptional regulator [Gellertiella hungarica]|uniref:DNA-binding CsgD family transcriptional regulator n=1 Tax=Gellertiella hungarica TaxID=1572859 RepID=A0A7W6J5M2_9HYPH|nr:LuxR family transcriptional regulator [Gellertiella hungarica]MBB4064341.1 DNA-binding CsgD family transcriptional regulator [Gellertiella hungarica]
MEAIESLTPLEKCNKLIEEISGFKTQFDVFRFMKRVTESFGSKVFMVMTLPARTTLTLAGSSVITNWPPELIAFYDREGLLTASPVIDRLRNSTTPFTYDTSRINHGRKDGKHEKVVEAFNRYGMERGAYFPVHDSLGQRGAISLSGERDGFDFDEMVALSYIFVHVFDSLSALREMDRRPGESLTDREIDCLTWTAAGKTSAEIAEILTLSEHTVNHYLNRATKKLDTVNRTQAVVKAMKTGLIK